MTDTDKLIRASKQAALAKARVKIYRQLKALTQNGEITAQQSVTVREAIFSAIDEVEL